MENTTVPSWLIEAMLKQLRGLTVREALNVVEILKDQIPMIAKL